MRTILLLAILACTHSFAQTWVTQSIGGNGVITISPTKQFAIDPYRNTMWFTNGAKASLIENDGTVRTFDKVELETAFTGEDLRLAFSPNHIYYQVAGIGLKSFDDYLPEDLYSSSDVRFLSTDGDTAFFREGDLGALFKYHESGTVNLYFNCPSDLRVKNGILYLDGGPIFYPTDLAGNGVWLFNDPDYLPYGWNDFKFSRSTDTLFIGQQSGISFAYKEDVLGSFTPSNTANMPSARVLQLEFDMNDSLWAVFGDANSEPFALAMLSGNEWVNVFDAGNSPIDFTDLRGVQFDTLNNIWVAETYKLHTIDNANTPNWLNLFEPTLSEFSVYPNPTQGVLHFTIDDKLNPTKIFIRDLSGRLLAQFLYSATIDFSVSSGSYLVEILNENGSLGTVKVIVE